MIKKIILSDREEWLKHRNNYIGGSEASAIIGMNPYMSNRDLFELKVGLVVQKDIFDKPYVKFGINAEPHIRELFKLTYPKYEMNYEDNNSFLNDKFPWAAASLDGWLTEKETGRRGIWECKTTAIVSSMSYEKWRGNHIPDNYYCQILHYFMVRSDCQFAHLTALLTWKFKDEEVKQEFKNIHIERSEVEEDIKFLEKEERRFWEQVQKREAPFLKLPEI